MSFARKNRARSIIAILVLLKNNNVIFYIVAFPEACEGKSFCFEKGNYPDEKIAKLLADMPNLVRKSHIYGKTVT